MEKKKILTGLMMIVAAAAVIGILYLNKTEGNRAGSAGKKEIDYPVEELNSCGIPGFFEDSKKDSKKEGNGQTVCELKLPYRVPDTPFVIEHIGQYTPFVEDGSDEPTANVMAMVVRNQSDTMIHFGEIDFLVNDSETASFQISTIPAGASVFVMEKGKREFNPSDVLTFSDKIYANLEEVPMLENRVKVVGANQEVTVENLTDENLGTVYVRYKSVLSENLYFGGITYSCKVEHVDAKAKVSAKARHFREESCKMIMIEAVAE